MFTRRCSERCFFLRPDTGTNNIFWYGLGWAAPRHGMILHTAVALSKHVYACATDPLGVYPDFLRDFRGFLARAMNAHRKRWEHFWDANQASVVLLEDDAAQLEKPVYVLANPIGFVQGKLPSVRVFRVLSSDGPRAVRGRVVLCGHRASD